jgi:hypothetical protein
LLKLHRCDDRLRPSVRIIPNIALDLTGTGRATTLTDDFSLRNLNSSIRLPDNRLNVNNNIRYISFRNGYALASLAASHRLTSSVEGTLRVRNLENRYTNDYDARFATIGRQTEAGLRIRW